MADRTSAECQTLSSAVAAAIQGRTPSTTSDENYGLKIFDSPIVVPNSLLKSDDFLKNLLPLDSIPNANGQPSPNNIYELLGSLKPKIEIGKKRLSASDGRVLREAESFLYSDTNSKRPTPELAAYNNYKSQSDEIKTRLSKPSLSSSDRAGLLAQLKNIETDWRLFGYRVEIDQRLEVTRRLSDSITRSLYQDWLDGLDSEKSLDPTVFDTSFNRSDWTRVSFSGKAYGLQIEISSNGATNPASDQIVFSFEYVLIPLRRRVLDHPFFADPGWRLKNGAILSDGAKTDLPGELLPRYYNRTILVKNIELQLPASFGQPVLDGLSSTDAVTISGMTFRTNETKLGYQSAYLSLPGPYLIGAQTITFPKSPNPEQERTWP